MPIYVSRPLDQSLLPKSGPCRRERFRSCPYMRFKPKIDKCPDITALTGQ
jgi:hypothetical protein